MKTSLRLWSQNGLVCRFPENSPGTGLLCSKNLTHPTQAYCVLGQVPVAGEADIQRLTFGTMLSVVGRLSPAKCCSGAMQDGCLSRTSEAVGRPGEAFLEYQPSVLVTSLLL